MFMDFLVVLTTVDSTVDKYFSFKYIPYCHIKNNRVDALWSDLPVLVLSPQRGNL